MGVGDSGRRGGERGGERGRGSVLLKVFRSGICFQCHVA
jgi:hypothetical protein